MIEIYPSKFSPEPAERFAITAPVILRQWLVSQVPSYRDQEAPPISIEVNGEQVVASDWAATEICAEDLVRIVVEPKGGGGGFLAKIFRPGPLAKLFGLGNPFAPKVPTTAKAGPGRGKDLPLVAAKGNQVSLNAVIPEIAGRARRYPDYLLPQHRYFGEPREQWVEMLLCIGKGRYQLPTSRILIGETPIISLGADAEFAIYGPGADLSVEPAATWWHNAPEVGATSTGTAGLELSATHTVEPAPTASVFVLDGDTITIPAGAGQFPEGWAAGMIVRIVAPYTYTVTDGGAYQDIIEGPLAQLGAFDGMNIEIAGANAGLYRVATYTVGPPEHLLLNYPNGAPATALQLGTVPMCIGFAGLRYQVTVEIQYRDMATAGAWTSVVKEYNQKSLDQVGFTERQALPAAIRPEVRMRRVGAKSTSTQVQDVVQWYGLRSRLQGPTQYPGVTVLALRLRGGNRLASQSESLVSVEPTRILPLLNGTEQPTRDIAPWVLYVAKTIGYTEADIDMTELARLDAIWRARGDTFDLVIDDATTIKGALSDALRAGFAEFTLDRGRIRPVRDEPRTVFEQMYTPQNMTKGLVRRFTARRPDDYDGVDVEYMDARTWQRETVQCRLPGDLGRKVLKINLDGVTDRTRAWRIGMRERMAQIYRRWTYSFETELDARNSRYWSYCAVADDVPGYGQSALVLSYAGGVIESSEPLDWSAGGKHVLAVRRPDGTLSGPYIASRIDDHRLSLSGALDFAPDTTWSIEPPHLMFGPAQRWTFPVLVTAIRPNDYATSVEAVNYDPRIYTYDDLAPAA
ncbi:hypothetical protein IB274_25225 [Pseudomonas sp. PDM18]|uniref:host specificity factor TipJ family phage tail protein n=1 Tax=Pseudomonas sp. PDM18 TaxID=2769253 RepID=UPI0017864B33|nr:host specificity factor TipJ family phage tail protein [Pseudomonas sp. PDM18]MBD9680031.1 hypothetical protein [Pseudomonas sp. PDM18]